MNTEFQLGFRTRAVELGITEKQADDMMQLSIRPTLNLGAKQKDMENSVWYGATTPDSNQPIALPKLPKPKNYGVQSTDNLGIAPRKPVVTPVTQPMTNGSTVTNLF